MDAVHLVALALIQGVSEFLPVSSSAHLILPSELLGWQDQGQAFDVAVHVGTLIAVLAYFRHDLWRIFVGWQAHLRGGAASPDAHLGWAVLVGSLPTLVAGFLLDGHAEVLLRSALVIGLATVVFGVLLQWADLQGRKTGTLEDLNWKTIWVIALAQILALIPGTSRSGVTITAGLAMGLDRESAARFSFLLAIPVIMGAGFIKGLELAQTGSNAEWLDVGVGALIAGASAFLCIHWFLGFIQRAGMWPFTIYRLFLGSFLIFYALL